MSASQLFRGGAGLQSFLPERKIGKIVDICRVPQGRLQSQPPSGIFLFQELWQADSVKRQILADRKLRLGLWNYIHFCNRETIRFVRTYLELHYSLSESGIVEMKTALTDPERLNEIARDLSSNFKFYFTGEDFIADESLAKALILIRLDDMYVGNKSVSLTSELTSSQGADSYYEQMPSLVASDYVDVKNIIGTPEPKGVVRQIVPTIRCGKMMIMYKGMHVKPDPLVIMMRHSVRYDDEDKEPFKTIINEISLGKGVKKMTSKLPNGAAPPEWADMLTRPYDPPLLKPEGTTKAYSSLIKLRVCCAVDKIVTSPFRRCIETAAIAAGIFGLGDIWIDNRLGERAGEVTKWDVFNKDLTYMTHAQALQTALNANFNRPVKLHWKRDEHVITRDTNYDDQMNKFRAAVNEFSDQYKGNLLVVTHGDWPFNFTDGRYMFNTADWIVFGKDGGAEDIVEMNINSSQ